VTAFFFAWNVRLRSLPKLCEFDTRYPCLYVADGLEIKGVGFGSIDNIVLRSRPRPSVFSMGGILNVNNLSFTNVRSTKTQINRNGSLSMVFDCQTCSKKTNRNFEASANTLEVSGLVYLARNYIAIEPQHSFNIKNLTTGTVNASRYSFTLLLIDLDNLTSLYL